MSRLAVINPTPIHTLHAALLAGGPRSLLSHLSAAAMWGAECGGHEPVDLTVLDRSRGLRLAGVRLHRPLDLRGLRPVLRAGLAVTNPIRTALDVGGVVGPPTVAAIVESLVIQRLVTLAGLRRAMAAHARPGRRASALSVSSWTIGGSARYRPTRCSRSP